MARCECKEPRLKEHITCAIYSEVKLLITLQWVGAKGALCQLNGISSSITALLMTGRGKFGQSSSVLLQTCQHHREEGPASLLLDELIVKYGNEQSPIFSHKWSSPNNASPCNHPQRVDLYLEFKQCFLCILQALYIHLVSNL